MKKPGLRIYIYLLPIILLTGTFAIDIDAQEIHPDNKYASAELLSYFDHETGEVANPTIILNKNTTDAHGRKPSDSNIYFCNKEGNVFKLPHEIEKGTQTVIPSVLIKK